jgi:chorismate mutase / prephenate dehydratase
MFMRHLLLCCSAVALFAQSTDLAQALEPYRQRINAIDDQIVQLLNQRALAVREVGVVKKQFHAPASAPGREEQVLQRVAGQARAPLTGAAVEAIYKIILAEMSAMEQAEMDKSSKSQ